MNWQAATGRASLLNSWKTSRINFRPANIHQTIQKQKICKMILMIYNNVRLSHGFLENSHGLAWTANINNLKQQSLTA